MSLRAVIFDLGGVVLDSPLQVLREYEADLGLRDGALAHMITHNGATGAWPRLERGELEMAGFFAAFDGEATAAGLTLSAAELMERVERLCQPREAVLLAIRRIRASGLRTAALTNNWLSPDQRQKVMRLRPEFDVFVESAVERMRKPDPRIYELVCERLRVLPSEAVFLDDIGHNLKPARALGMTTIKVGDDPLLALRELESLLHISLLPAA